MDHLECVLVVGVVWRLWLLLQTQLNLTYAFFLPNPTRPPPQTPLFDMMFEEFSSKHLLHKLEQGDRAAVAAVSAEMESV